MLRTGAMACLLPSVRLFLPLQRECSPTSCSSTLTSFYFLVRFWTLKFESGVWLWQVVGCNGMILRAQKLPNHSPFAKSSENSSSRFSSFFFNCFATLPPTPRAAPPYSATLGSASVRGFFVEIYQPCVTNLAYFLLPFCSLFFYKQRC